MCQCFGIPAFPVAQPGHCGHLWLNMCGTKRTWILGNNVGGLGGATLHEGISFVWEDITKHAWTVMIYEKALEDSDSFVMSELYLEQAKSIVLNGNI